MSLMSYFRLWITGGGDFVLLYTVRDTRFFRGSVFAGIVVPNYPCRRQASNFKTNGICALFYEGYIHFYLS